MLLGVIADDFTGASDIANTLKKSGMSVTLVAGVPTEPVEKTDAVVIALKTRSVAANVAVELSLAALVWFRAQNCQQIFFKYCSTFDSTANGNIGPVAVALADALQAKKVLCCPAFPANGRTVYQGHLFVGSKLLSESGMEKHPITPMTDSNIRRWMAKQCKENIGLIDLSTIRKGHAQVKDAIDLSAERVFIADAIDDHDLMTLGTAVQDHPLITGGSGIALGLPNNFRRRGQLEEDQSTFEGATGPCVILAGSCSGATLSQIEVYKAKAPALRIQANEFLSNSNLLSDCLDFANQHRDETPLIYSSDTPVQILETQTQFGVAQTASAFESFFGACATKLVKEGFERVIVAGGETSGAVVSALGTKSFTVGPEIAPGVPCLQAATRQPLALALKSGNFGGDNFFSLAAATLKGHSQ